MDCQFLTIYIMSSVRAVMWLTPDKNSTDYHDSLAFLRDNLNKDTNLLMIQTKVLSDCTEGFLKKIFNQYFLSIIIKQKLM